MWSLGIIYKKTRKSLAIDARHSWLCFGLYLGVNWPEEEALDSKRTLEIKSESWINRLVLRPFAYGFIQPNYVNKETEG